MTWSTQERIEELPAGLAERLQRMAEAQTAGSRPWPGVDLALQRSHRRRVAGLSTLVAACVLITAGVFGGLLDHSPVHTQRLAPVAPSKLKKPAVTLQDAGYTGKIGGSLASDTVWLDGFRDRVIDQVTDTDTGVKVASRRDVLVLWAGDLSGKRYAVVMFRLVLAAPSKPAGQLPRTEWGRGIFEGPEGAAPSTMKDDGYTFDPGSSVPTSTHSDFLNAKNTKSSTPGVVFVVAPRAVGVYVATSRRFRTGGGSSTAWRALQKQGGAVWVGRLTAFELFMSSARIVNPNSSNPDEIRVGDVDLRDEEASAAGIATPGTDLAALASASDQVHLLGASPAEQPVLATSIPLPKRTTLAATVLRSPDNGYLFGFAERHVVDAKQPSGFTLVSSAISDQRFPTADSFMAAVQLDAAQEIRPDDTSLNPGRHYAVIAPAGAVSIRMRGRTAQVHNRLATLDYPPVPTDYQGLTDAELPNAVKQIAALDAAGRVIGTVIPTPDVDDQGSFTYTEQDFGNYSPPN